jgi:iron complex transport system ATP-binding protein
MSADLSAATPSAPCAPPHPAGSWTWISLSTPTLAAAAPPPQTGPGQRNRACARSSSAPTPAPSPTPRSETGIRWNPNGSRRVLLAGDETALPAISSILESLPADVTGHAFLEVPDGSDFRDINTGSTVSVTWLARNPAAAARGHQLHEAVRSAVPAPAHSGTQPRGSNGRRPEQPDSTTPEKRQGAPAPQACPPGTGTAQNIYAWVAAEAGTVKRLRRYLVNEGGLDPRQSEFRAYWSLGKAGSGVNGSPL